MVGEPTLEKGFDKAVTRANKVAKESFDAEADQLADELIRRRRARGAAGKRPPSLTKGGGRSPATAEHQRDRRGSLTRSPQAGKSS